MFITYSQKYNFPVFYFVPPEVAIAALKIYCVMIPSLVNTSFDFGLFRVVRPYGSTKEIIPLLSTQNLKEKNTYHIKKKCSATFPWNRSSIVHNVYEKEKD